MSNKEYKEARQKEKQVNGEILKSNHPQNPFNNEKVKWKRTNIFIASSAIDFNLNEEQKETPELYIHGYLSDPNKQDGILFSLISKSIFPTVKKSLYQYHKRYVKPLDKLTRLYFHLQSDPIYLDNSHPENQSLFINVVMNIKQILNNNFLVTINKDESTHEKHFRFIVDYFMLHKKQRLPRKLKKEKKLEKKKNQTQA